MDDDGLMEIGEFDENETNSALSPISQELNGSFFNEDDLLTPSGLLDMDEEEDGEMIETPLSPPFSQIQNNQMNNQMMQPPMYRQQANNPQNMQHSGLPRIGPPSNLMNGRPLFKTYNVQGDIFKLTSRYQLKYLIGSGAYGIVCSGFDEVSKRKVAIKKIPNLFHQSREFQKRIFREIKLLQHFNHENIVSLYDIIPAVDFQSFREVYFVLELMDTDLRQIIDSKQQLTEDHVKFFLYQILKAVKYIHSASVLHRDLKPENILLNSDCDLKVCDFGLARGVNFEMLNPVMSTPYVATRYYRAPELLCMWDRCSKAIDIWSVGCIFAELLNRKPLFKGRNYLHQIQLIVNMLGTPRPNEIRGCQKAKHYISTLRRSPQIDFKYVFPGASDNALDLLKKMLRFDPFQRITVEQALEHPFLESFHEPEEEPNCQKFDFGFERILQTKNIDMKRLMFSEISRWNENQKKKQTFF